MSPDSMPPTDPLPTREGMPTAERMPTAEAIPVPESGGAPAQSEPVTEPIPSEPPVNPDAPAAAAAATPAIPARTGGAIGLVLIRRLVRFAFALALFAAGAYLGWQVHVGNQPVPVVVGDPAVVGNPTPALVAELANAIAADDADAIRSALNPEIFANYTAEMQRFGIASVDNVETLGTFEDGPRTATALIIQGRDVEANPFTVNLVVIAQDGQIVRLR